LPNTFVILFQSFAAEKANGAVRHSHHVGIGMPAFEDRRFLALLLAVTDGDLLSNGEMCHRSNSRSALLVVRHSRRSDAKIVLFHRDGTASREISPGLPAVGAV
jgi:hypothetical protein